MRLWKRLISYVICMVLIFSGLVKPVFASYEAEEDKVDLVLPDAVGGILKPEEAKFGIRFLISGTEPKTYIVEYSVKDAGIENQSVDVVVQPSIEKLQNIDLKGSKNGIFTLDVTVKCDNKIVKTFSNKISIIPVYQPQFMDDFNQKGMGEHFDWDSKFSVNRGALLQRAGNKLIRDSLTWERLEKEKGVFNNSWADEWVQPVTKEGISLIALLCFSNRLYNNPPAGATDLSKYAPKSQAEIEAFCNYATNVAKHFPQIMSYEIWNEPNIAFWKPSPNVDDYTNLVKGVYVALKKVNPDIRVIGGATSGTATNFVGDMFARGCYPYVDAISFHPYVYPDSVDKGYKQNLEMMENTILKYGGWKDSVISEVGWSTYTGSTGVSEVKQATEMVKEYIIGDCVGIKENALYTFYNTGSKPDNKEDQFGIIFRDSYQPKPAYAAYTQMNIKLGGALYFGELNLGNDIQAHLYKKDGAPLMVLWVKDGSASVNYDFGTENVRIEDMYGNVIQGSDIQLDQKPVFVEGLSNSWFNKAASNDICNKYDALLKTWDGKLPEDSIKKNIQKLKEYAQQLGNTSELPTEEQVSQYVTFNYDQGIQMIDLLAGGKSALNELDTVRYLYQLHKAGQEWGNLLAAAVKQTDIPASLASKDRINVITQMMNDRVKDTIGGSLMYSKAITRYAKEFSVNAEKVKNLPQDNKGKAGIVKGWDRLSVELSKWVEKLAAVEKIRNTDLLLQVSNEDTNVFAGVEKSVKVSVGNQSAKSFTGKLKLVDENDKVLSESQEIQVEAGKTIETQIPVTIDSGNKNGKLNSRLKLFQNDQELNTTNLVFNIQSKVQISLSEVNETLDNIKNIKVTLTNPFDAKVGGEITVEPPQGWSMTKNKETFSLDSKKSRELSFQVSKTSRIPFNYYVFGFTVKNSEGQILAQTAIPLSFTAIVKNTEDLDPAKFNGDISNWSNAYPIMMNPPKNADTLDDWRTADVSAMMFAKWDEKYFYILGNIYDNGFANNRTGSQIWDGDSIQVSFDTKNTKTTKYDSDDYEYGFARTGTGNEAYLWQGPKDNKPGSKPSEWVNVLRDPQKNNTRYLIRIPREELNLMEFRQGSKFGFNFCYNDADWDSRERFIQLASGTADSKKPSLYYTWTLDAYEAPVKADVKSFNLPIDVTVSNHFAENTSAEETATVNSGFADLNGHWAKDDIEDMVLKGIVKGMSPTSFAPDANITRVEFLALLTRAINLKTAKYTGDINDVAVGSWYADTIQAAKDAGIIPQEMLEGSSFKPEVSITREEMTALIVNSYNKVKNVTIEGNDTTQFSDFAETASWAQAYVSAALKLGVINGVSDEQFAPKANADRAQAVVIVKRLLGKI